MSVLGLSGAVSLVPLKHRGSSGGVSGTEDVFKALPYLVRCRARQQDNGGEDIIVSW